MRRRRKFLAPDGRLCKNDYIVCQPPELSTEDTDVLGKMQRLGAKLCPQCQFIITKDGGCQHMACEQCLHEFFWSQAENVMASASDQIQEAIVVQPPKYTECENNGGFFTQSHLISARSTTRPRSSQSGQRGRNLMRTVFGRTTRILSHLLWQTSITTTVPTQ